jgi:hypothetical protein
LITVDSATQEYSLNVPTLAISVSGSPSTKCRSVPSVIMPPMNVPAVLSQMYCRPLLQ